MWGLFLTGRAILHSDVVECGTNVMLDHFDPAETIEIMEREKISYMFAVPAMLNALARNRVLVRDWSSLRVVQIGGSPIADETALGREVFGPVLFQGYGQRRCRYA